MSIKDNLLISSKDVSMDKVKEICKRVGIHSFIEYLPQGYETIVNETPTICPLDKSRGLQLPVHFFQMQRFFFLMK